MLYARNNYATLEKYKYYTSVPREHQFAFQCEALQSRLDAAGISYFKATEFFKSNINPHNVVPVKYFDGVLTCAVLILQHLDVIRGDFGARIFINSGYRSPLTNSLVKGVKNSRHMRGCAVDIRPATSYKLRQLYNCCAKYKRYFSEFILYDNFIHIAI